MSILDINYYMAQSTDDLAEQKRNFDKTSDKSKRLHMDERTYLYMQAVRALIDIALYEKDRAVRIEIEKKLTK